MMHMRINGGSMSISDDNQTTASSNVAKQVYDHCIAPDSKLDEGTDTMEFKPDITVKD